MRAILKHNNSYKVIFDSSLMAFTFEKDMGYERAPPFYQELAKRYLIGGGFESFSDAFKQLAYGDDPLSSYFQVVPVNVRPETLPAMVEEAEIKIILREEGTGIILSSAPEAALPILRAKAVEKKA